MARTRLCPTCKHVHEEGQPHVFDGAVKPLTPVNEAEAPVNVQRYDELLALGKASWAAVRGQVAWQRLAAVLKEFRETRLFRWRYETFEEFCEAEFGFSGSYGYRLQRRQILNQIESASSQKVDELSDVPERVAQPVLKADPPVRKPIAARKPEPMDGPPQKTTADWGPMLKELGQFAEEFNRVVKSILAYPPYEMSASERQNWQETFEMLKRDVARISEAVFGPLKS